MNSELEFPGGIKVGPTFISLLFCSAKATQTALEGPDDRPCVSVQENQLQLYIEPEFAASKLT
jgi:hypothetical protein